MSEVLDANTLSIDSIKLSFRIEDGELDNSIVELVVVRVVLAVFAEVVDDEEVAFVVGVFAEVVDDVDLLLELLNHCQSLLQSFHLFHDQLLFVVRNCDVHHFNVVVD